MLQQNQEIIYRRNGEEIGRFTQEEFEQLPPEFAKYFRYTLPFARPGQVLFVPAPNGTGFMQTTRIRAVEVQDSTLACSTQNSVYEVEFRNIDLEGILRTAHLNEAAPWAVQPSIDGKVTLTFPYGAKVPAAT